MYEDEIPDKLMVFDYAPNLRIVGGFHSLTLDDKRTLEGMIDESDFVALEWDEYRKDSKRLRLFFGYERSGWDRETNSVYCSPFDAFYLNSIMALMRAGRARINRQMERQPIAGLNEIRFSYDYATQKGKAVYLVDMPYGELAERLFGLSTGIKLRQLSATLLGMGWPAEVENIMGVERNRRMLSGIKEREGSIMELKRSGLLVVGLNHAEAYQEEVEARKH